MKKIKEFLRMCLFRTIDGIDRLLNYKSTIKGLIVAIAPILTTLGLIDKGVDTILTEWMLSVGSAIASLFVAWKSGELLFSLDKKPENK